MADNKFPSLSIHLSEHAAQIVKNSLDKVHDSKGMEDLDFVVEQEVGELSLNLRGEAASSSLRQALVEIAQAYVRSLAIKKLGHEMAAAE